MTTSYPSAEHDPAGHFVQAEARSLVRLGHEVVVLAPLASFVASTAHGPRDGHESRDGVEVVALPGGSAFGWPGAAARLRQRPWRIGHVARWFGALRRELARRGPFDEVVAHWSVPCGLAALSGSHCLRLVSHGADVRLLGALPRRVRTALVTRLATRATSWRFVSLSLQDELLTVLDKPACGAVAAIALVEPSPCELPRCARANARVKSRIEGRAPYVVLGRLTRSKGVHRAIEYVAARGDGAPLVIVGDGPERRTLEALAHRHGIDAHFTGTVERPEALAWLAASRGLVFASRCEGLPTVLREAHALGVPVHHVDQVE